MHRLYSHLCQYTPSQWLDAVELLSVNIHEIDRDATRIWFAFYPLNLHLALEAAPDKAAAQRRSLQDTPAGKGSYFTRRHRDHGDIAARRPRSRPVKNE